MPLAPCYGPVLCRHHNGVLRPWPALPRTEVPVVRPMIDRNIIGFCALHFLLVHTSISPAIDTYVPWNVLLQPGAIASGGGPDAVVPTLKRPDPWGPPLRLKVGAALVSFATSIGELYPQRLDADGVSRGT